MNCKGHIFEDVAIAKVLAALWGVPEREAYERWMKAETEATETEGRIADAVLSLLAKTIEHMKGPCIEHLPSVRVLLSPPSEPRPSTLPRYYPTTRATRLTRARGELDVAIHKVAEEQKLSIVDVLALLHSAAHPWVCAAEGEEAERRKAGEIR